MEKPVSEMSIDELIQTNKHMEKLARSIIQHLLGNRRMDIADWDKLRRDSEK